MIIQFLILLLPFAVLSICLPNSLPICLNETLLRNVEITTKEPIILSSMRIVSKFELNITSSTNITFVNMTIIMPFLNIESPLIVIKDSHLSSNASVALGLGHNPSNLQQGNAYAAIGSMCVRWGGVEDLTYGRNCWTVEQIKSESREKMRGSGGETEKEYGGGTIIIYAINALYLSNATIASSGAPFPSSTLPCPSSSNSGINFGGSGGLILIQTTYILPLSSLQLSPFFFPTSSIIPLLITSPSAQPLSNRLLVEGGGYCLNDQGGSGGRINIVSKNSTKEMEDFFDFSTKGGGSLDGRWELCSNGGSGTICLHTLPSITTMDKEMRNEEAEMFNWKKEKEVKGKEGERILKIDGKGFVTGTPTIISIDDSEDIEKVVVENMGYVSMNDSFPENKTIKIKSIHFRNSFFEDFVQVKDNTQVAISIDEIFTQNS